MPEGDTLHRHAAALRPLLAGRTLIAAWEHGTPRPALAGREVISVEALGKHLVITLSGGATIHVHLGITGRIARRATSGLDPRRERGSPLLLQTTEATIV